MRKLRQRTKPSGRIISKRRSYGRQLRVEHLEDRRLLTVFYRIDAGGPQLAGTPVWSADTAAAPSSFSNASTTGNSAIFTTTATIDMSDLSIPAGTPMALFQTERYDKPAGTNLIWDFPVTPGQYLVRLYFSENFSTAFSAGARVFDVSIEGQTVLDHYDAYADVGSLKGVVKSFIVSSDSDLNITFLREVQNPSVKGIEILSAPATTSPLVPSATNFDFGNILIGQSGTQQFTLTNGGQSGDPNITINPSAASLAPSGSPFNFTFSQQTPIILAPGESTIVSVNYVPTSGTSDSATLQIPNSGPSSPLSISLMGTGATTSTISFGKSTLNGTTGLAQPTSLQFGPDGRLYVAQQNGLIRAYTIARTGPNTYNVTATESI